MAETARSRDDWRAQLDLERAETLIRRYGAAEFQRRGAVEEGADLLDYVEALVRYNTRLRTELAAERTELDLALTERDALREKVEWLEERRDRLRAALHDAIRSPMGVVPDSAAPFYESTRTADAP